MIVERTCELLVTGESKMKDGGDGGETNRMITLSTRASVFTVWGMYALTDGTILNI